MTEVCVIPHLMRDPWFCKECDAGSRLKAGMTRRRRRSLMRDPYPLRLPDGLDDEAHLERGVALGAGGDAGSVEAGLEAGLEGDPAVELAYGGFLGGVGAVERGELALAVAADFECRFHYG